ncbi:MAG: translation initiation factor IF-2 [Bacteroides sp.]|nr:translation initiation factor IF-2 [Bacteroides sp.]MDD6624053.1 translation initiation factor IF-2 [Bacteroides sp.]
MAEIRLNKLTRQFNVGLQTLVDFLNGKGANVEMNPNAKVSDEYIPDLEKAFGGDAKAKEDSERVQIKIKEIIEKGTKKKEDDEEEPASGTVIIRGAGNGSFAKAEEAEAPAEEVKAEPEVKPEEEAAPAKGTEPEVVPEQKPEPTPEPGPVQEPEPVMKEEIKVEEKPVIEEKPVAEPEPAAHVAATLAVTEEKPEKPSVPTPAEEAHSGQAKKSDLKKSDRAPKEFNPKVDKAKLKAEHKLQKAASSSDEEETTASTGGLKIVGKVDLSQFEPKKNKKRERIAKGGSQKVDVNKIDNDDNRKDGNKKNRQGGNNGQNGKKDFRQGGNNGGQQQGGGKNRRKDRNNDRFKPAMTEAEQEEMQKEIQKQVKETYARMNDSKSKNNFGAKHRKEKRELASQKLQEEMAQEAAEKKILKVTEFVTVNDLATLMNNTPVNKVIEACFSLGLMVSINQRLDAEALVLVAEEFGYKVEFVTADIQNEINQETDEPENEADLVTRPPIITVMGHVDHGKTSLLDYIRQTNVIAGEAGGITQHIGAYNVVLHDGRRITFLDTPGHEAFTAMRARGAQLTDLAIIIIAADDAVMPQTVEAINHAQAAGVPMVFAINKIDKPGAQPEKIRQQLAQMNILVEDWGGKYQCQEISAKKGLNVDKLLEKVLLETDLMDLKANPKRLGVGTVIESSLDKGRGYLATILVQDGTVHTGDMMLSGCYYGRVKAMFNERGQKVETAGPSTPVSILGLNGAPSAGDKFNIMNDEKEAKAIANKREQLIRIQGIKTQKHMTLEEIGRRIAIGNFKELNIIVKGDVDGSVEALSDSLIKLSTEEVRVNVIHKSVGAISESDVMLATASDAIIIGFQVRPSADARNLAEKEGIEIRLYSIIYDAINEVTDGIEGMLEPEKKEEVTATAEVKQTFHISKVGTIAGCLIKDGKMQAKSKVRLIRDGIVVYTGELSSLKRGKDDAKEVIAGMECGIGIDKYNDVKPGDIIEAFQIVEIKRTL